MSGNLYRGAVDAVDRFMTRWRRGEADKNWLRHAAVGAKSRNKGETGGEGG